MTNWKLHAISIGIKVDDLTTTRSMTLDDLEFEFLGISCDFADLGNNNG